MREIKLGAQDFPIHASLRIHKEFVERYNAADDKIAFSKSSEVNNWMFAELINEGVEYSRILLNKDISKDVPFYPLTAEKIAMIATVADMNSDETIKAVADEWAACNGNQKNFEAGELKAIALQMMTATQNQST